MSLYRTEWLLASDEPWTRYRLLVDFLGKPETDPLVQATRLEMLAHPQIQALISDVADWPGKAIKRHNDASHPIIKFSVLADFGVRADDPGMADSIQSILSHQSNEGFFQTLVNIPKAYGGSNDDLWAWVLCDAPNLLFTLLSMGLGNDSRVCRGVKYLADLVEENGFRCVAAPELGKFRGPGRKADPCPIANLLAIKALAQAPEYIDSSATRLGAEVLLAHWEHQKDYKLYLFGIGADFRKLKYPFVWYDLLHVVEVLSSLPFVHDDLRFREMVATLTSQAGADGRFTAGSMYLTWKGWSFTDKKKPSPWLTLLVERIIKRLG